MNNLGVYIHNPKRKCICNCRHFYLPSCGCLAVSLVAKQNSIYKAPDCSAVVVIGINQSVVNLSAHQQNASQPSKGEDRWSLGGSLSGGCEVLAER
jgi:hypothetical protein